MDINFHSNTSPDVLGEKMVGCPSMSPSSAPPPPPLLVVGVGVVGLFLWAWLGGLLADLSVGQFQAGARPNWMKMGSEHRANTEVIS